MVRDTSRDKWEISQLKGVIKFLQKDILNAEKWIAKYDDMYNRYQPKYPKLAMEALRMKKQEMDGKAFTIKQLEAAELTLKNLTSS